MTFPLLPVSFPASLLRIIFIEYLIRVTHCARYCGRYKGESDIVPALKELTLYWERRKERSKSD